MRKTKVPRPVPNADQTGVQAPLAAGETAANSPSENTLQDPLHKEVLAWDLAGVNDQALARVLTKKLLLRIDRLFGSIDYAFMGQPFLPGLPPDAPANQNRVGAYMSDLGRASKLLEFAIGLVRFNQGMAGKVTDSESKKHS